MNWFMLAMVFMNLGAAIVEFKNKRIPMGVAFVCYAISTLMFTIISKGA